MRRARAIAARMNRMAARAKRLASGEVLRSHALPRRLPYTEAKSGHCRSIHHAWLKRQKRGRSIVSWSGLPRYSSSPGLSRWGEHPTGKDSGRRVSLNAGDRGKSASHKMTHRIRTTGAPRRLRRRLTPPTAVQAEDDTDTTDNGTIRARRL